MTEPNSPRDLSGLSDDEWRLIRLFRLLDAGDRGKTLRNVGERALSIYSVEPYQHLAENPKEAARDDLTTDLEWRLRAAMPYDSTLCNLRDYDYPLIENGLGEGEDFLDAILGTSDEDECLADRLVASYLDGAKEYDEPLMTEFEASQQEMEEELHGEAKKLLREWRERIVSLLERRMGGTWQ